jgi:hypothetical protein
VVQAGVAQLEVEVEPWVMPAGVGAEMDRNPIAVADTGVDVVVDGEVGRWGLNGTLSDISGEHFRMELPQPSSSWFPCGRRSHHL